MKVAIFYPDSVTPKVVDAIDRVSLLLEYYKYAYDMYNAYASDKFFGRCMSNHDLAISIGGDGTILRVAKHVSNRGIPILGINAGRMGYLADVKIEDVEEAIYMLLTSQYTIEDRSRLCLSIDGEEVGCEALNDIVFKGQGFGMVSVNVNINGLHDVVYRADGLVVSTPSGSTGYSVSAGGPVISPNCETIALTPVAPHMLNMRSIIIPSKDLSLTVSVETRREDYLVVVDGDPLIFTSEGCRKFTITNAKMPAKLIKLTGQNFYKTLTEKLLWGVNTI